MGSAVKEAEVLSAFQEINEDLQGKTEVVEKCESRREAGRGGERVRESRVWRMGRNSVCTLGWWVERGTPRFQSLYVL